MTVGMAERELHSICGSCTRVVNVERVHSVKACVRLIFDSEV